MKRLASQDRQALIKLASSLRPGSSERRAILAGLTKRSNGEVNIPGVHILERAKVYGSAQVSSWATVTGDAEVYGDAHVYGDANVYGKAHVYGNAYVRGGAHVYGNADISGNAVIWGGDWDGSEGPITEGKWLAPGVPA